MTISMIGIDHDRAPVDIRALFAFTKKNAGEAMERLKETAGIYGCIILSTALKYGRATKKNRKFPCMSVCAV